MARDDQWLLPDGVEEVLPQQAAHIEHLRRRILDRFAAWGYELVFPPLIEFLDSLLNGAGRDLADQTFKLTDQLSGRLMGVRADITPQVARLDAHTLRRNGPVRLCYCSTALRTRPPQPGGTRMPYQIGVELFGHAGMESDTEVIALLLETLALAGFDGVTLDLGHVGIYRALVRAAGLSEAEEKTLSDIYVRKARQELEQTIAALALDGPLREALAGLPWLTGDATVLARARALLRPCGEDVLAAIDELERLVAHVRRRYPDVTVHLDLGELRGYHYHTGCLFAAYVPGCSEPVAKGGRYDHIGEVFGRARPATGFSADLKLLASRQETAAVAGILAEGALDDDDFLDEVRRLRERGERVVLALPHATNAAAELQCDRRLVREGGQWRVISF